MAIHHFTNQQIATLLRNVSISLALQGSQNFFKSKAYESAAESIENLSSDNVFDIWKNKKLDQVPHVGKSIEMHLTELFTKGKVSYFQKVISEYPAAMYVFTEVQGIGPKNALKLCKGLGISKSHGCIERLEKAAQKGYIAKLEGFGEDSQTKIIENINLYKSKKGRIPYYKALPIVKSIEDWVATNSNTIHIEALGSFRRKLATVGDLDFAISSKDSAQTIKHIVNYPAISKVIDSGDQSASVVLSDGTQVDFIVQDPDSFGSLLQHFTGSKHHNIALRELALQKNLSLSEHGIKTTNKLITFKTEQEFYNFLGLQFVPPELRENYGEIELALSNSLPKLIETKDIKGDLHIHSNFETQNDHDNGKNSIEEIVKVAKGFGYEYIATSEHNPSPNLSSSKINDIMRNKYEHVQKINSRENNSESPFVFNSLEIDIQRDGKRALEDKHLEHLDFAIVSIHSLFDMDRTTMTQRVLDGLNHPKAKILAHPTGRKLLEREGIQLDWDKLFSFCVEFNKVLEINAWPNRLDLPEDKVKDAIKHGVKIVINTDSHDSGALNNMQFGINIARRGWCEAKNVINTQPLEEIKKHLLA